MGEGLNVNFLKSFAYFLAYNKHWLSLWSELAQCPGQSWAPLSSDQSLHNVKETRTSFRSLSVAVFYAQAGLETKHFLKSISLPTFQRLPLLHLRPLRKLAASPTVFSSCEHF